MKKKNHQGIVKKTPSLPHHNYSSDDVIQIRRTIYCMNMASPSPELNNRNHHHNSSHADNIIVDYCLETTCYKDLESIVLKILDTKRYRQDKDFFDCDINIIKKAINKSNKLLLEFRDNCDENKILSIDNEKKIIKKYSKKYSKKNKK